jgi:uncharacterized protein YaiL (DUF2058 family)
MANSLQDQLMKAGLIDRNKAKAITKEKRKQENYQRKHRIETVDEAKENARRALEEKAERDRQLNAERDRQAQERAIVAQIRQLIENSRIDRSRGEVAYNFTDGTRIKKIYVTAAMLDQLGSGKLAIVRLDEKYEVVPKVVAEKIQQRDPDYVIVSRDRTAPADAMDEDDPYAAYQIPDDLMW